MGLSALEEKKRKLVGFLLENKVLVSPEFLEKLNSLSDSSQISELINLQLQSVQPKTSSAEQNLANAHQKVSCSPVKVLFSYNKNPKKITVQDFINYFNSRYSAIKKILQQRTQLENITSINRLKTKPEKDSVSVVGMVYSKEESKNGLMVTLEDPTGSIKVYFGKNKQDLWAKAKDIVHDEVIAVTGVMGKNIIFGNDIISPDIPMTKELKKSPVDEYALFLSDIHVGSKQFLEEEFMKLVAWLKGEIGSDSQKEISSKIKYIFITGDLVDGVSMYATQHEDLNIMTYRQQYEAFIKLLRLVPSNIRVIISPGNHDVVPLPEPQLPIPKEYAEELYNFPNVTLVSNPALVNIGATEGFPGFDVLIYHGYSYNYYADTVESVRVQKPNISERADLVMKLLLQKRHLAPTYEANPHLPTDTDYLVIDKVPDIFISGDVHKSVVFTYKNVITGIVSSCFQSKTEFQERVGHTPDPGRVPIINLKTRDVKILNFSSSESAN